MQRHKMTARWTAEMSWTPGWKKTEATALAAVAAAAGVETPTALSTTAATVMATEYAALEAVAATGAAAMGGGSRGDSDRAGGSGEIGAAAMVATVAKTAAALEAAAATTAAALVVAAVSAASARGRPLTACARRWPRRWHWSRLTPRSSRIGCSRENPAHPVRTRCSVASSAQCRVAPGARWGRVRHAGETVSEVSTTGASESGGRRQAEGGEIGGARTRAISNHNRYCARAPRARARAQASQPQIWTPPKKGGLVRVGIHKPDATSGARA